VRTPSQCRAQSEPSQTAAPSIVTTVKVDDEKIQDGINKREKFEIRTVKIKVPNAVFEKDAT
jgi:hypothetical protein